MMIIKQRGEKAPPGDPVEEWGRAYLRGSGDCASGFHFCNPPPCEKGEGEGNVRKLPQQHTSEEEEEEGLDAIRCRLTGAFRATFMDAPLPTRPAFEQDAGA